jgi:hypothetical protein
MHQDDLRRVQRVKVCCRADVRDRFGIWTAVTEDVCARGCRLVSAKVPRVGAVLDLALSSDLFSEVLDVTAYAAWVSDNRVGVNFVTGKGHPGALSPAEWIDRLVDRARVFGPEPLGSTGPRLAPAVRRPGYAARAGSRSAQAASRDDRDPEEVRFLPL